MKNLRPALVAACLLVLASAPVLSAPPSASTEALVRFSAAQEARAQACGTSFSEKSRLQARSQAVSTGMPEARFDAQYATHRAEALAALKAMGATDLQAACQGAQVESNGEDGPPDAYSRGLETQAD